MHLNQFILLVILLLDGHIDVIRHCNLKKIYVHANNPEDANEQQNYDSDYTQTDDLNLDFPELLQDEDSEQNYSNENYNDMNEPASGDDLPETQEMIPNTFHYNQYNNESNQKLDYNVLHQQLDIQNYNRETIPRCPQGLNYHRIHNSTNICYVITRPTTFPPACPYPNIINPTTFAVQPYLNEITDQKIWAYGNTVMFDGFGEEFVRSDWSFSTASTKPIHKDCIIFDGLQQTYANCSDAYPGICIYTTDSPLSSFNAYCKSRFNHTCISSELTTLTKCFCISKTNLKGTTRNAFCKKLAEPIKPYQNFWLGNVLQKKESCWINLRRRESGNYQWSSNKNFVNYTYWSQNINFSKTFGAISATGWILEDDGNLNCAICEVDVENHPSIEIQIKHNKISNQIEAEVTNPLEAYNGLKCYDYEVGKSIKLTTNNETSLIIPNVFPVSDIPHYYWCKSQQIPTLAPVYSNRILASKDGKTYGHEYALQIRLSQDFNVYSIISVLRSSKLVQSLKLIFEENMGFQEILYHIITPRSDLTIKKEYEAISKLLRSANHNNTQLSSSTVCLASTTSSGHINLHWPETLIGTTSTPYEPCLQDNYQPITRKCTGNFLYGGKWSEVNGTCSKTIQSPHINSLKHLLKATNVTLHDVMKVTEMRVNTSLEFHLIAEVFERIAESNNTVNITEIGTVINNLVGYDKSVLKEAQVLLNSTDRILENLDKLLIKASANNLSYDSVKREKLSIQVSDLRETDIIGIKLIRNGSGQKNIIPLHESKCVENLLEYDSDIIMLIPQELKTNILNCIGPYDPAKLIVTIFYDGSLFNEAQKPTSRGLEDIISILIPKFNCPFSTPLQILFKMPQDPNFKCGHWTYGHTDLMENIQGHWFMEKAPKENQNSLYQICEFSHVTHFSLLVLDDSNISQLHIKILDTITMIGCGLSLIGLVGIFITAIAFRRYRSNNGVVINLALVTAIQIVLIFLADRITHTNPLYCIGIGAVLHYVILSQFCWMLIIAHSQYHRYVVIIENKMKSKCSTLKKCLLAWGIPFIYIAIAVTVTKGNIYGRNSNNFCYAIGNNFIYGVLVPVFIMLFINFMIFTKIMLNISLSNKIKTHRSKSNTSLLQLRLAIMLYFLLGMTWGFGLLVAIGGGIIYSYLFCLTATLQGFILFIFFVILKEDTRWLWVNLKSCFCLSKSNKYEVNPIVNNNRNRITYF